MQENIHVGDVGTDIILNASKDLTSQTTLQIKYIKPSGESGAWDAEVHSEQFAKYKTQAEDIDEAGLWGFFIYVVLATPVWAGHGRVFKHRVLGLGEE